MSLVTATLKMRDYSTVDWCWLSGPVTLKTRLEEIARVQGGKSLEFGGMACHIQLPLHQLLNWIEAVGYKLETISYSQGSRPTSHSAPRQEDRALAVFREVAVDTDP